MPINQRHDGDNEPREITRVAPRRAQSEAPSESVDELPTEAPETFQAPSTERTTTAPLGYTPIELPSLGRFYGPGSVVPTPALPDGRVEIRKMRVAEDEALLTGGGDTISKLSKILAACVKLPKGFDPANLLVTDRFFIMIALRRIGLGSKYPVSFRCSECGAHNKETVDIVSELSLRTTADDVVEPVLVHLPDTDVHVGLRFKRGFDEADVAREMRRAEARGTDLPIVQENLKRQIVEIDGESVNVMRKMDLLREMTQTDLATIRTTLSKSEPGIDLAIYPECRRCQFVNEFDMPFTNEFFRPSSM